MTTSDDDHAGSVEQFIEVYDAGDDDLVSDDSITAAVGALAITLVVAGVLGAVQAGNYALAGGLVAVTALFIVAVAAGAIGTTN